MAQGRSSAREIEVSELLIRTNDYANGVKSFIVHKLINELVAINYLFSIAICTMKDPTLKYRYVLSSQPFTTIPKSANQIQCSVSHG